jgi:hypothetical protein
MNTLHDVLDKITSGGIPTWAMAGTGIVLLLIVMKVAKGFLKFVLVVLALAFMAGAVWWHFHNQGRI